MLFVFATKFCISWFVTRSTDLNVGGKTLNITIQLFNNASKQVARFCCLFNRSLTYVNFLFSENNVRFYSSAVKGLWDTGLPVHRPDSSATLMSPNKGETAVHGCHYRGGMAVHMREVLARPWVGVCVPLALNLSYRGMYMIVFCILYRNSPFNYHHLFVHRAKILPHKCKKSDRNRTENFIP